MKLPDKIKNIPILSTIISLGCLSAIIYFLLIPALAERNKISQQIKNKRLDLIKVKTPDSEYANLREDLDKRNLERQELKKSLFWERDTGKFLNELTRLAEDLNIEFVYLKPETISVANEQKDKKEKILVQVPIDVAIKSSYNDTINFLKRIEEGKRFIRIDSLNIESGRGNIYEHTTRMQLSIFIEKGA